MNMLHGSDTTTHAENELRAFFEVDQTLAIIKPDSFLQRGDYNACNVVVHVDMIKQQLFCITWFLRSHVFFLEYFYFNKFSHFISETIIDRLEEAGLTVSYQKTMNLTKEIVSELYKNKVFLNKENLSFH